MDKKKLARQIAALCAVAAMFAAFNISVFFLFTKPCLPRASEGRTARTIDVWRYLPFDDASLIVREKAELGFSGSAETLPVLDGAEGLYPLFSAFANAVYPESAVSFDGERFSPESRLQMNNTLRAYKGVVDGTVDVAFNAAPSAEQLAYAREKGVELEFVPIGREAFVFLVNGSNPVDGLTSEQIRGAFSGRYTNWKQLGGNNVPINALRRIDGSGSQSALVRFMGDEEIKPSPLAALGSSLGFSFRFYAEDVVRDGSVKLLAVDGVAPTRENITNDSYPLTVEFYAIYDKANPDPDIRLLIDWILSEQGQRIVEETGFSRIR